MVEEVAFAEFEKFDFRVGKIIDATQVLESKKLIKLLVDFGMEKRQAVAGLHKFYKPEELVGKITHEVNELEQIAVEMLDLAAIESGRQVVRLVPTPLANVVDELVDRFPSFDSDSRQIVSPFHPSECR